MRDVRVGRRVRPRCSNSKFVLLEDSANDLWRQTNRVEGGTRKTVSDWQVGMVSLALARPLSLVFFICHGIQTGETPVDLARWLTTAIVLCGEFHSPVPCLHGTSHDGSNRENGQCNDESASRFHAPLPMNQSFRRIGCRYRWGPNETSEQAGRADATSENPYTGPSG